MPVTTTTTTTVSTRNMTVTTTTTITTTVDPCIIRDVSSRPNTVMENCSWIFKTENRDVSL